MAGNYPDAPSWRMAYDRDGSIGVRFSGVTSELSQLTEAEMIAMNDEGTSTAVITDSTSSSTWYIGVIFPELRDIDAIFVALSRSSAGSVTVQPQTSADTTNGLDGTWANLGASFSVSASESVRPEYRTGVDSATALAIRGVRLAVTFGTATASVRALHLYGERSPGQALNALELWHPSSDEKLPPAWLDWGNTPRGSSEDRTFRVKNISTVSTAQDVRVAFDALTDGSPSVPGQHLLSFGGGSYLAQVNVGDLAPGAISGPVTLRRVTASDAQLGLFTFRVFAEPDVWS